MSQSKDQIKLEENLMSKAISKCESARPLWVSQLYGIAGPVFPYVHIALCLIRTPECDSWVGLLEGAGSSPSVPAGLAQQLFHVEGGLLQHLLQIHTWLWASSCLYFTYYVKPVLVHSREWDGKRSESLQDINREVTTSEVGSFRQRGVWGLPSVLQGLQCVQRLSDPKWPDIVDSSQHSAS